MADQNFGLRSILMDVRYVGASVVNKKKLMHLLGAKYDKPWVWSSVLAEWEALGFPRAELLGSVIHDNICLICPTWGNVEKVAKWAG